jgi:hypothetical protein
LIRITGDAADTVQLVLASGTADITGSVAHPDGRRGVDKLFAWESAPSGGWTTPEFLAKYEDSGIA